jgi:hypothetical protein
MNYGLSNTTIFCPYCGESIEILIDNSAGNQSYIEDCQVCCAPIQFAIQLNSHGEIMRVQANRDSD